MCANFVGPNVRIVHLDLVSGRGRLCILLRGSREHLVQHAGRQSHHVGFRGLLGEEFRTDTRVVLRGEGRGERGKQQKQKRNISVRKEGARCQGGWCQIVWGPKAQASLCPAARMAAAHPAVQDATATLTVCSVAVEPCVQPPEPADRAGAAG
jgi:hypothetical protein